MQRGAFDQHPLNDVRVLRPNAGLCAGCLRDASCQCFSAFLTEDKPSGYANQRQDGRGGNQDRRGFVTIGRELLHS